MNTNNQTEATGKSANYDIEHGIISIDAPILNWRDRFTFYMLRLARIITVKEHEIMNLSAERVSRLMDRHIKVIGGRFSAMDIREKLANGIGEIRGGGYEVVWDELDTPYRRNGPRHFDITFRRIYSPEDMVVNSNQTPEPATVTNNQPAITQ